MKIQLPLKAMPSNPQPSEPQKQPSTGRGSLKIFLGFAAGVGKTFSMLDEARRRKKRGQDVVIGVVDTRGRMDTEAELGDLETIPLTTAGAVDVAAILSRRPGVVLIDDLERNNPAGSERTKRWQDVEVLLAAGLNVLTTVNVQNLETLNDRIREITKLQVDETVPDSVLHAADEIELVDVTPRALINRLDRGAIYPKEQIDQRISDFYREGNLNALREIAMREAAGRVDEDLSEYRRVKNIETPWATRDLVMVCVSPNRNSLRLLRKGWRMGQRLNGEVIAVYVEQTTLSEAEQKILKDDFALAERLKIKTVTLKGQVAAQLIKFAKVNNVTQILLGHPDRTRIQELVRPNLVSELTRELPTVDITLVAAVTEEKREH